MAIFVAVKSLRTLFSYLIILSLLLSTGGVSVYKHYCGDFLASFSIYTPADNCSPDEEEGCEASGMDCCEDETEFIAADMDLIKQETQEFQLVPNFFLVTNLFEEEQVEDEFDLICFKEVHPPVHAPPAYILHSQLTYYG